MNNVKKILGGVVVGAAIGAALGILLAPASGAQTRKRIAAGSSKLKDDAKHYMDDSLETMRREINSKIDKLATGGKQLVNHASEKVKV
jgi:gas vesicle protein